MILWGYSQGGGAAAAAEMHATYAPDVNIRGGFAGGVPTDLLSTARVLEGSPLLGALGYAIAGMYETHPETRAHVEELLNERGNQWIADSSKHCIFDSFLTMPIPDSRIKNNASEMLRLMSLCAASSRYGCSCPPIAYFLRARRAVGRITSYYR
ncbi:lipase family protein [Corynebacterium diphtheriae]|uniref:lipase family protein n=1 Tax=Corynebacterium diphtheriae TaxID=1717 RepID=UPI0002468621|nr:lipase family protein [Corynebacterium diphtheriae]AEX68166.1 putative secretory lipase [Corynebacterium diphtheriae C7 (beta)]UFX13861.1 lipase family protein [Corynebacterium diphtheriae]